VGDSGCYFKQAEKKTIRSECSSSVKLFSKSEQSITKSKGSGTGMPAENILPFAFFSKLDRPVFLNFAKECRKIKDSQALFDHGPEMFQRN